MPRFLITYGTTDGHTAKIARFLSETFRSHGARVDIAEAREAPSPESYDGIVVAGSVHAGHFQRGVQIWVRANVATLRARPTAFLGVCLAILDQNERARRELETIKARFIGSTGWKPGSFTFVPGALLYTRYGWLKRLIMKRIVRKAGGDTDTSRDYEYTDWEKLRSFATDFLATVMPSEPLATAPTGDRVTVP